MGLFGELLSLPLKFVNLPLKIVDEVVFDGDSMLSAPLDAVNELPKHIGNSVDKAIEKTIKE